MILYLSRNESADLLDGAASEHSLPIRKLSGNFCLAEFIIKDMRKFASCQYFCLERLAIAEKDGEFLEALRSFQMMYNARVVVIHESADGADDFTRGLAEIGVIDIVTAADKDGKLGQIAECLSAAGMRKRAPKAAAAWAEETGEPVAEPETLAKRIIFKEPEDEQYRFDCVNVRIGIIGATRRVGVTTAALGVAGFIRSRGGAACYAALNLNRHLESIAEDYSFDAEEDYYTCGGIDFYESMNPRHDYNFIVSDFGSVYNGEVSREAVKGFKECEARLLCGASGRRHEVLEFAEALKAVRSAKPQILTYAVNPGLYEFFCAAVTPEPLIMAPVRDMMDFKANALRFKSVIEPYIVETSRRL